MSTGLPVNIGQFIEAPAHRYDTGALAKGIEWVQAA